MVTKQKTYTSEFKAKVSLEAIKGELTINQITSKYGVHASQINRWKQPSHDKRKAMLYRQTKHYASCK